MPKLGYGTVRVVKPQIFESWQFPAGYNVSGCKDPYKENYKGGI
jgi:hypothetical protein